MTIYGHIGLLRPSLDCGTSPDMARARGNATFINLTDPIFAAFAAHAASAFPDAPITASIREACLSFMETNPDDAARSAARRAAWLETKAKAAELFAQAMKQVAAQFEQQALEATDELQLMREQGMIP